MFKKKKIPIDKLKMNKYIKFHYYKIDDLRCKKYADNIDQFVKIKNNEYYFQRVSSLFIIFLKIKKFFQIFILL